MPKPGPGGGVHRAVGSRHGTGTSSGEAGGAPGALRSNRAERAAGGGTAVPWGAGQRPGGHRPSLCADEPVPFLLQGHPALPRTLFGPLSQARRGGHSCALLWFSGACEVYAQGCMCVCVCDVFLMGLNLLCSL